MEFVPAEERSQPRHLPGGLSCCDVGNPEPALTGPDLHVVMRCAMCTITCTRC
jgi:hypothetical protein